MPYKDLEKQRAYCREHSRKIRKLKKTLKRGKEKIKMVIFKKKKSKGKPVAPPVEDVEEEVEEEEENEEEELEAIESETEAIKKEIETTRAKRKPPVEEELTEEKVKQILINFEQRLQKIEYNLRLIP